MGNFLYYFFLFYLKILLPSKAYPLSGQVGVFHERCATNRRRCFSLPFCLLKRFECLLECLLFLKERKAQFVLCLAEGVKIIVHFEKIADRKSKKFELTRVWFKLNRIMKFTTKQTFYKSNKFYQLSRARALLTVT